MPKLVKLFHFELRGDAGNTRQEDTEDKCQKKKIKTKKKTTEKQRGSWNFRLMSAAACLQLLRGPVPISLSSWVWKFFRGRWIRVLLRALFVSMWCENDGPFADSGWLKAFVTRTRGQFFFFGVCFFSRFQSNWVCLCGVTDKSAEEEPYLLSCWLCVPEAGRGRGKRRGRHTSINLGMMKVCLSWIMKRFLYNLYSLVPFALGTLYMNISTNVPLTC